MTIRIEAYDRCPTRPAPFASRCSSANATGGRNSMNGMPRPCICWRSIRSIRPIAPARPRNWYNQPHLFSPASPASRATVIAPWRLAGSMRTQTIPTNPGDTSSRGSTNSAGRPAQDEVYEGGRHGWLAAGRCRTPHRASRRNHGCRALGERPLQVLRTARLPAHIQRRVRGASAREAVVTAGWSRTYLVTW